jgi:sec-independent protein translocase protein TatC
MAGEKEIDKPEEKKRVEMPFLEHIEELRWRLIKSLLAIAIFTVTAFFFAEKLYKMVTWPLGDTKLYYTEITGSFYAYLKIAFYTGIIGALPFVLYQLWKFIAPGLYTKERKIIIALVFFSTILFLIGAAFCFFIVLPFAIKFMLGYGGGEMTPIITVSSYISFTGMLMLAFGASFELPIIGFFFGKIGLISARMLSKVRPYAVVIILFVAAILTPTPDVFTQLLLAIPLYFLYELTIIIVKLTGRKMENRP